MIRLALLDYAAALRERKTWLAAAALAYAVASIPAILARPPSHVRDAIDAWFGTREPFAVFMFVWIDLAMNKSLVFLPVILGTGAVIRERETGVLAILGAKPISMRRYFLLRATTSCAVMLTLYAATQLLGMAWFSLRVPGFRAGTFLIAMALHAFVALFATALCATLSVWIGRRGATALVALVVLATCSSLALVGFYQPAWRTAALVNPFALGAQSLGHLDALGPAALALPMLVLAALTIVTLSIGAARAARVEV